MNEMVMIQVEQLNHHPENPRKDLGDLTELAESIKANGIMQNLTVVPAEEQGRYLVVIGNRRMEAAKMAGVTEVPCVISNMDHKTQVATMLMENMQRQDLTVYEQAQGFQMMMDLGFSAKDISEKTGFGETTVRRRLKMAELDAKLLKKACETKGEERQITLYDFERLAQVEDIKERNRLLKDIGGRNFEWSIRNVINHQKAKAVEKEALKELKDAGVKRLKDNEEYSSKYERLWKENIDLAEWKPGKKLIPKSKEQLYFFINDTTVKFYTEAKKPEKAKPVEKSEAEKAKEKQIDNAWKIADRITVASAERRAEFVEGMTVKPSNAMQMLRWTIIAAMSDLMNHNYNTYQGLKKAFELQGTYSWDYVDMMQKKIMEMPQSEWPTMIMILFEGLSEERKFESFTSGYRKEWPQHQRNPRIEQCYAWLTEFGYQMSDEEIQMMAGTHELFRKGRKNGAAEGTAE